MQKHNAKGMTHLKYSPRIRISNTDYGIIQETVNCLKMLELPFFVEQCNRETTSWNVCIIGWERVAKFSKVLFRHIVGRKAIQLGLLNELYYARRERIFLDDCTQKERNLIKGIFDLNKKGRGVLRD